VQAHTLGEVGFRHDFVNVFFSGIILPIFIEIGSYLTDKEQKISCHQGRSDGGTRILVFIPPPQQKKILARPLPLVGTGTVFFQTRCIVAWWLFSDIEIDRGVARISVWGPQVDRRRRKTRIEAPIGEVWGGPVGAENFLNFCIKMVLVMHSG